MSIRQAIFAILGLITWSSLHASEVPPDLAEAMHARLNAVWTKDAETWSLYTADQFTVVVPHGGLQTKAERLVALKTEEPQTKSTPEWEDTSIYGDTALRRLLDGNEWVLEIWVKADGVWKVVAAHVSIVEP